MLKEFKSRAFEKFDCNLDTYAADVQTEVCVFKIQINRLNVVVYWIDAIEQSLSLIFRNIPRNN